MSEISSESSRMTKARAVVAGQGVKLHRFFPSGRTILTVVGRECEFLVDYDPGETKYFCACGDFYYRVLSERVSECYHLLACKIAFSEQLYVVVNFKDEELPAFMKALVSDIFGSLSISKSGKREPLS